ncbi:hypothetical protein [Mesorhizobium sp.]|uniref:hypothetical protein n=1 Tax=Mesorhizobium sp. TaxID=1871066 RepID=UPI000FE62F30|nr:hypothetical protein [Mesorhizobium sp.]RWK11862.1 MAG: hypothetical protein EOR39_07025 [Mesorhizobium sp.]TIQ49043.1 MAG: hypothetical protein E5X47_14545 [Mesorhizobium sp.]TIQ58878.1 MAG: hypothetical protein E5X46_09860 [Mesorhizobium sp.]
MKTVLAILLLAGAIASAHAEEPVPPQFSVDKLMKSLAADKAAPLTAAQQAAIDAARAKVQQAADEASARAAAEEAARKQAYRLWVNKVREDNWKNVPVDKRMPILMWCYGQAGGVDGNVPDYSKEADCLQRQLDGWARVDQLIPPEKNN